MSASGILDLALCFGQPPHVLADLPCRVDERRQRREIHGARVQTQEVETNPLERRHGLGELALRCSLPLGEHLFIHGACRNDRPDHLQLGAGSSGARLERLDNGRQLRKLFAVRLRQRGEQLRRGDA